MSKETQTSSSHPILEFLKGSFTLGCMILNTIFWCPLVYVLAFLKSLTPVKSVKSGLGRGLNWCSENWVSFNNFFLNFTNRIQWDIRGGENLSLDKSYFITANHQSWVDIIVLQRVFNRRIPFPKFFVKKQLIWIPFLGAAFKALDFPFMNRFSKSYLAKHPEMKGVDMKVTQESCREMSKTRFSLINFLEGTRFTLKKYRDQKSPFKHHLKPRAGGLAFAVEAFEGKVSTLVDVTIVYSAGTVTMWSLLKGKVPKIIVSIREISLPKEFLNRSYNSDPEFRKKIQLWVNDLWTQKDQQYRLLSQQLSTQVSN